MHYDDNFETIRRSFGEAQPISYWQQRAGFSKRTSGTARPKRAKAINLDAPMREVDNNEEIVDQDQATPTRDDEGDAVPNIPVHEGAGIRRSQREPRPTTRYQEYMAELGDDLNPLGELAIALPGIVSMTAQAQKNPDVMYWH